MGCKMSAMNSEARKRQEERIAAFSEALGGDATPVGSTAEAFVLFERRRREIIRQNLARKKE